MCKLLNILELEVLSRDPQLMVFFCLLNLPLTSHLSQPLHRYFTFISFIFRIQPFVHLIIFEVWFTFLRDLFLVQQVPLLDYTSFL